MPVILVEAKDFEQWGAQAAVNGGPYDLDHARSRRNLHRSRDQRLPAGGVLKALKPAYRRELRIFISAGRLRRA
jgi:hypothetical protein